MPVYFAYAVNKHKPIKIGHTDHHDVSNRIKGQVSSVGWPLFIMGFMDGDLNRERETHLRFRSLAFEREWFVPGPSLLEFIGTEAKPWEGRNPFRSSAGYSYMKNFLKGPWVGGTGEMGMGEIIRLNLVRLGFGVKPDGRMLRRKEIEDRIWKNTRRMIFHRIDYALIWHQVHLKTIERIAKGLGVKPEELTRKPKGGKT